MSQLYISTQKPPDLDLSIDYRIDPEQYALGLKKRWPDAKLAHPEGGTYALYWELNEEGRSGLSGGLQSNGLVVNFGNGPKPDVVEFLQWHRKFVPMSVPLYLFDASLDLLVELMPEMAYAELESVL